MYQRCDSRIYWAWAIISSRWHRRYVSVPRWLFQERRLSLTLRLTFAVQRSCELEHLAITSQPSFVCLLLLKAHKVSPARAPSVSMTVSKKPLRSSAEQALASAAHMPTKDMLTASSVNYSRVSLHYRPRARSVFGPECHLLEAQSSQAAIPDHPLQPTRRQAGEFQREPIRREAEAFQPEPKWRLAGTFQPEPTPPLAVRYLMGWASQPYGLAQQ